jgi:D-apiose dehydrogenase
VTKIGLVGLGFFGKFHVQAWQELASEGVELSAVVDRDAALAAAVAAEFNIPHWFSDVDDLIAAGAVNIIDVATPMQTHLPIVKKTLRAGLPTIVQKPLAPTWSDVVAINKIADETGVFLAVHENFRNQRPFVKAMELLASYRLGAVSWARFSFRTGLDVYENQPYFKTESRLAVLDVGVHMIDLAMCVSGEVESVFSEFQMRSGKTIAEDTATLLLRHCNGAISVVECTYEDRRKSGIDTIVEIECEKGGISILPDGELIIVESGKKRAEKIALPQRPWAEPPLEWVQDSIVETCRSLHAEFLTSRTAATDIKQNTAVYAVAEAAYISSVSRKAEAPPKLE